MPTIDEKVIIWAAKHSLGNVSGQDPNFVTHIVIFVKDITGEPEAVLKLLPINPACLKMIVISHFLCFTQYLACGIPESKMENGQYCVPTCCIITSHSSFYTSNLEKKVNSVTSTRSRSEEKMPLDWQSSWTAWPLTYLKASLPVLRQSVPCISPTLFDGMTLNLADVLLVLQDSLFVHLVMFGRRQLLKRSPPFYVLEFSPLLINLILHKIYQKNRCTSSQSMNLFWAEINWLADWKKINRTVEIWCCFRFHFWQKMFLFF